MKTLSLLGLTALLASFSLAFAQDAVLAEKKFDLDKLQGTYKIVKGEKDGKPVPQDRFEGAIVSFGEKKVWGHDRDRKEFFGATFVIDTSRKPCTIEMVSTSPKKGEKASGIIEMDGDTVRICYALPGGKEPLLFKTSDKQHLFVLKRTKVSNR
jgi:uncharacterized protein (TIGR03067 family)